MTRCYLAALNDKGGIDGHPIEVTILDDQAKPDMAASNAKKFHELGVNLMIGHTISACYPGLMNECESMNIPFIMASGDSGASWELQSSPNYKPLAFCSGFNTKSYVGLEVQAMVEKFKPPWSWGIFGSDSPASKVSVDAKAKFAQDAGLTPVTAIVASGTTDVSALAPKFMAANVKLISFHGAGGLGVELYKAMAKLGWQGNMQITWAETLENTIDTAKLYQTDTYYFASFPPFVFDTPETRDLQAMLKKYNAAAINSSAQLAYPTGPIIEYIFRKAGYPATTDKMLAAMTSMNLDLRPLYVGKKIWTSTDHLGPTWGQMLLIGKDGKVSTISKVYGIDSSNNIQEMK
jgi:branched-chain amino acid transport system substrate-binding protein